MSEVAGRVHPLEIRSPQGDLLAVNPRGGKIKLSLSKIDILTSKTRWDGKPAETHPCTPIFGKNGAEQFGLNQHGDMRGEKCGVKKTTDGKGFVITHEVMDSPGRYPHGINVLQRLWLEDGVFTCETIHSNLGLEEAPVFFGEHLYWAAPQGFRGTLVNGRDVTSLIETDTAIPLESVNSIQIPGLPEIELKQEGLGFLMLWVGKNPEGEYDKDYVCLEPVEGNPEEFFGSADSILKPGAIRSNWFSISIKKI